jgi:pyruvate dehydrogenase E1 component
VELARIKGGLAERLVTTSPDVSISTNLGGWINRVGVFAVESNSSGEEETPRLLRWQPSPEGQHVELGIGEMNLFLLLGQLGLSEELFDECLVPIGTVYDPFICRGLDALIYGVYAGSRFVFAGTPSGVTLSPEGGAHQSSITVSIGMEIPNLQAFEPCFARETEWCLLEGIRHCLDRGGGLATYLRLSTRPVDQGLVTPALERLGEDALRSQVLRGGYRLVEPPSGLPVDAPRVLLAASGAVVPEVVAAAGALADEGVAAVVLNVTSASRLYREWQRAGLRAARHARPNRESDHLATLISPPERRAPIVTIIDGASHSLAFLGGAFGQRLVPLGVDAFGQSGRRGDLYREMGIDVDHIVNAALLALSD